jgi:starch synthase
VIAFLPWGDVLEDWLEPIGLTAGDFGERMAGGWMFNYVRALGLAGVGTVFFCFSRDATTPERRVHSETGAPIWVLPPSRAFRLVRARQLNEPVGSRPGPRRIAGAALRNLSPFLATPPRALSRLLRAEGCRAMLCQEYEDPRFDVAVVLGRALGMPTFASFQGGDHQVSRLERPIRPLTMRMAGGLIIAAADEIRRVQRRYRLPDAKVARIFNPVDLEEWQPGDRSRARAELGLAPDACVIVSHGRIRFEDKATDVLVEAWRRAAEPRGERARLLLVGEGPDSPQLERLLRDAGVPSLTWIREFVTDRARVRTALSAADAYVLGSRLEGQPVAPLEAMAMGLPVVATDASGVPDIFEQGEADGGLVVPRDDVDALAAALGRVVDDAQLRQDLGARARARVERAFSLGVVGRQLREFMFRETSASPRAARP